jgi:hypothetical protein
MEKKQGWKTKKAKRTAGTNKGTVKKQMAKGGGVDEEKLKIVKVESGRDTGMARGAIGLGYKVTLSNNSVIDSDDEDLLDRYVQIRKGGRKTIEQLNKILKGKEWKEDEMKRGGGVRDKATNIKTDNLQELKPLNEALKSLGMKYQSEKSEFIDRYKNELNDVIYFDNPKTIDNWKESLADRMSSALSQYRIYPERYATGGGVGGDDENNKLNEFKDFDFENDSEFLVKIKDSVCQIRKGRMGNWIERFVYGEEPYGFGGKSYQSYLDKDEIVSWLMKDYKGDVEEIGSFSQLEEAFDSIKSNLDEEDNESYKNGGGVDKLKRKKFLLYTNPNNTTNKAYVALGDDIKSVMQSSRAHPGSYTILYTAIGTNEDLQKAKAMFSNYSFTNDKTIMKEGGSVGGEYSTKNASRDDVNSLIDMLNNLDISYDLDGSNEWIDFDMTELDREQQEQAKQWLGIGKMAEGGGTPIDFFGEKVKIYKYHLHLTHDEVELIASKLNWKKVFDEEGTFEFAYSPKGDDGSQYVANDGIRFYENYVDKINEVLKETGLDRVKEITEDETFRYAKGGGVKELDLLSLEGHWNSYNKGEMSGKQDEGYITIKNEKDLNDYIKIKIGDVVKDINVIEKGKNYPYNRSNPYSEDTYLVTLKNGTTFEVERSYGSPNWSGNVNYKEQIKINNISVKFAKGGGVDEKDGLYVTGRTREDNTKIGEMIDAEGLHAEFNVREGYWFFPEERDMYDDLEKLLEGHFAEYGINARFEGIFAKGGGVGQEANEMAIYKNKVLNETHKMGGLRDLEHAWNLVNYVSKKKGWNPIDVHVTLEKKMARGGYLEGREEYEGYRFDVWYRVPRGYSVSGADFETKKLFEGENLYFQTKDDAIDHAHRTIGSLLGEEMKRGGGVGDIRFNTDTFWSNIDTKWDDVSKITSDVKTFLITAYEASGDELTNDIISAIEKGIKAFGVYTKDK